MRRVEALDGIRGIAISMVMAYHFFGIIGLSTAAERAFLSITHQGWAGVEVFFSLSGYLITNILWKARQDGPGHLRRFYIRRVLRIWPLYFAVLIVLAMATNLAWWTSSPGEKPVWAGLYLSRQGWLWCHAANIGDALRGRGWFYFQAFDCTHFWTLAVEEHFYLVWPWLLAACPTRRVALVLCGVGILASLGLRAVLPPEGLFYALSATPRQAGSILIGSALALAMQSRGSAFVFRIAPIIGLLAGFSFIALVTAYPKNASLNVVFDPILLGIGSAGLIAYVVTRPDRWLAVAMSVRPLCLLGQYSYGLYVFHQLLFPWWLALFEVLHQVIGVYRVAVVGMVTIAFSVSLILAVLSYHFYEMPFLRLKVRFEDLKADDSPPNSTSPPPGHREGVPLGNSGIASFRTP